MLKAAAFKIFLEYKDVFAWSYKDLKGVPPEMCPSDTIGPGSPTGMEEVVPNE